MQTQVCPPQVVKSGSAVLRRCENSWVRKSAWDGDPRVIEWRLEGVIGKNHFWKLEMRGLAVEYADAIAGQGDKLQGEAVSEEE